MFRLIGLAVLVMANTCLAVNIEKYIPIRANQYLPILKKEIEAYFPDIPKRGYPGSLIELESCITLTHKWCWSPNAQLSTKREFAAGMGQITKAYNADGSVRFDSLAEMRKLYKTELKDLSWANLRIRPDLQIRALLLMVRESYKSLYAIPDRFERLAMADAAYNGGLSGLNKERRYCGLKKGCNAKQWFGHVEKTCLKSRKILYGKRSACDINRDHPVQTLKIRLPKYERRINQCGDC